MTGIWTAIKSAAPALAHQQHDSNPSRAAVETTGSSTTRSSSPPTVLGTSPSSRSLPRPPSSLDARANTRSQASPTPQSHPRSPGTKSPSRLSRNTTTTTTTTITTAALKDKGRGKDRDTEAEDAGDAGTHTTAIAGTGKAAAGSNPDVARPAAPVPTPGSSSAIDPLSQHIFMRKNTEPSIPQRLTQMAEGLARASSELSRNGPPSGEIVRDKSSKRASSFLSRLSMTGRRKKDMGDLDSDSELGSEARMDGINARVFSQTFNNPLTGGGYVPHHKEPPRYIRTKASNKRIREFNRMFLAQELVGTRPPENNGEPSADEGKAPVVSVSVAGASDRKTTRTGGAIWATEFSKDGKYLATAGRDHVVRIWAVLSTPEERRAHEEDEIVDGDAGERLSAPVFRDQPIMEFQGHTGEVLDLSWSKNNFLLSSSMDKTVRLWHLSRPECLCTFKHKDFVTRLAFHPRDDRFFLAGSLDTMLRLWSIPDSAVAFSVQLPDLVTAVAFSPDGKVAIAGLLNGLCMFYETEGLKPSGQIHVRSSRGKNAKGSKITGIQTMAVPPPNPIDTGGSAAASVASADVGSGEVRVLITSNDSRIRIYNLRDKCLEVKLKGHENLYSQIAATFSDDGKHVICGSEDRKSFIWSLTGSDALVQDKDKWPCEYFEAHGDIVTTALFAPTKTRMLLGQSGDPIYDLCNPPPVVLQSLEEAASAAASQDAFTNVTYPTEPIYKRPEPSRAYIARSTHYDGNIIVTTGDTGIIKVFRQDCAFAKRRHESWETGSTLSRRLAAHGSGYVGGGLGRSASVLTRTSGGSTAHSRRGSLSRPVAPGTIPPLNPAGAGVGVGAHPDRILSWRQGIEHGGDRRSALFANGNGGGGSGTPFARSERSVSPTKASRTSLNSAYNLASEARRQPYGGTSPARNRAGSSAVASPTASVFSAPSERPAASAPVRLEKEKEKEKDREKEKERKGSRQEDGGPSVPPTPGFTLRPASVNVNAHASGNAISNDDGVLPSPSQGVQQGMNGGAAAAPAAAAAAGAGGSSTSFWNLGRWKGITGFRAVSSSSATGPVGQGTGTGAGASGKAKSGGSRGAVSSGSKGVAESDDERGGDADATGGRANRESVGGGMGDRRRSMPPGVAILQGGSDSDARSVPSVPVDGVAADEDAELRGGRDGLPFRGHEHASRLSAA